LQGSPFAGKGNSTEGRKDHKKLTLKTAVAELLISRAGQREQRHVAKAFGVPLVAIKRATKLYCERGPAGFFLSAGRCEGSKLNAEKLEQARAGAGSWAWGSQRPDRGRLWISLAAGLLFVFN
jgi:hypothetical protein